MSLLAVQGGATGTGTVTLLAPVTNTNRTLTLPDVTGTVALQGGTGVGKVLQVVTAITAVSAAYATSTPTSRVSLSITPSSASNKIMLFYNAGDCNTGGSTSATGATSFYRNGSSIRTVTSEVGRGVNGFWFVIAGSFLDSPSSTSAQTYAVFHFNPNAVGTFTVGDSSMPSVLTAMEIAG